MASSNNLNWLTARLPSVEEIRDRLESLVPQELDPHGYARREMAARSIFVMLYVVAVEGEETWIRPTTVTDMTDEQAARTGLDERRSWLRLVLGRNRPRVVEGRWYSENTREPIRDETLRQMVDLGIVTERTDLPTTSPKPRYALAEGIVALCDPDLAGARLEEAIEEWRRMHLSASALARLALIRRGAVGDEGVVVSLPNGEVRRLAPGPSAGLTRSVVEDFAPRFLSQPAVVLISESARKVGYQDRQILDVVGLDIDGVNTLPDVILVDVGVDPPLLVFVECVASAGEVTTRRRGELTAIAEQAGYRPAECAFVTAFHDRVSSPFKASSTSLAWGSFAWFETEPERLIHLYDGHEKTAIPLDRFLQLHGT